MVITVVVLGRKVLFGERANCWKVSDSFFLWEQNGVLPVERSRTRVLRDKTSRVTGGNVSLP